MLQYEKSRKRQQKIAKQQARDTEREAQKRAVLYTLRMQDMLNSMGEVDKENFRNGANGAVVGGVTVIVHVHVFPVHSILN